MVKSKIKQSGGGSALKELHSHLQTIETFPRTFEKGEMVTGKIVSLKKGEALVDVRGRAEGVISGKELYFEGKKSDLDIGDDILVYVVNPENEKGQTELSIRRTGNARKWKELKDAYDANESITVTVMESNSGGVIVSISSGIRGFIPTSQLDNERIYPSGGYGEKAVASENLQKRLAGLVDEEIKVKISEIEQERNRVILSEKLVTSAQDFEKRENTLKKSEVGTVIKGKVTGIAPFGLFVNAEGLEGLVHLSEISWDKVEDPAQFYKVGDEVDVQIIGIEDDGRRIAYSIKRLQHDPWEDIVKKYKVGQMVKGKVQKVVDYGAFVRVDEGVNGLIHISELSDGLVTDPLKIVKPEDEVDLQIISISRNERHLGLSLKRSGSEDDQKTEKKAASEPIESAEEMRSLSIEDEEE